MALKMARPANCQPLSSVQFKAILLTFPKGACETLRILGNQPSQSQTGKGQ